MIGEPVFRTGEIRRNMDVFTFDGTRLGTVLMITEGSPGPEGGPMLPSVEQRSEIDGEALGPFPTQSKGNFGPITQSARNRFATHSSEQSAYGVRAMLIGDWFGLIGRRTIPLDDVQTVSMERVILRHPASHYSSADG